MTVMTILSLLLVVSYLGITIWRHRELPETISDMVYWHPKKEQWVWSAWLVTVGLLLFAPLTERCGWMGWLTEVCLLGSALTPLMNPDTRVWHKWLGIATGILSQICVVMLCPDWLFAWAAFVFVMGSVYVQPEGNLAKAVIHKGVFVAEVVCTVSLMGALLSIH